MAKSKITTNPVAIVTVRTIEPITLDISWSRAFLKLLPSEPSLAVEAEICRNGENSVSKSWPIEKNSRVLTKRSLTRRH